MLRVLFIVYFIVIRFYKYFKTYLIFWIIMRKRIIKKINLNITYFKQ